VVGSRRLAVHGVRRVRDGFLVRLDGIDDRNAAEALRGQSVSVDRDVLELDDGDLLLQDLVGCRVELDDGSPWGTVVGIDVGPQNRLIVHDGDVERLVPLVDELVVDIDVGEGRIRVSPPEGLPEWPRRR
jgi:16S rRNA processing protein RimM